MNTLYIECKMGAAGDMLTAALLELVPDKEAFVEKLNKVGIPGVEYRTERSVKCGITGTHMTVTVNGAEEDEHMHEHHHQDHDHDHHHQDHDHDHHHDGEDGHHHDHHHDHDHEAAHGHEGTHHHDEDHHHDHDHEAGHHHHHSGMADIEHIVRGHLDIPDKVKDDIMAVYALIAEAESHVHGVPVTDIHFHEVGTMDAVADITAVCMLINELSPDKIIASPIHVGSGTVHCAHGILPVPAPATAHILQGIPSYGGSINGELCTPTGAALLKHFADDFGDMPIMKVSGIGYGMGRKDFETANCVRVMIGEGGAARTVDSSLLTESIAPASHVSGHNNEEAGHSEEHVLELSCNVDDMSAEAIGYACERFFEGGAFEAYTIPVGMKKSRPGTLIRVMCDEEHREALIRLIFKHTTTIGIRETVTRRYVLDRHFETIDSPYGQVRRKISEGYGVTRSKFEYEDLARIASEQNISIDEVLKKLDK